MFPSEGDKPRNRPTRSGQQTHILSRSLNWGALSRVRAARHRGQIAAHRQVWLDTISTGVTIAFAMECYGGVLTRKDTGGPELTFGNGEAALELIEQIANRRGFGDLLAEGVMRASRRIGRGAEEYAMHAGGQELLMHEPKLKYALGVGYAASPTGADHCHSMHDTKFTSAAGIVSWKALGILEPVELRDLGPDEMRLATCVMNREHCMNSPVICRFLRRDVLGAADLVRSATGWNASSFYLTKLGERVATMARVYNVKEGFSNQNNTVPGPCRSRLPRAPWKASG